MKMYRLGIVCVIGAGAAFVSCAPSLKTRGAAKEPAEPEGSVVAGGEAESTTAQTAEASSRPARVEALKVAPVPASGKSAFYKKEWFWSDVPTADRGLFTTRPSETASLQTIDRFGPVGMGIELHQPAFVMKIKNIEKGSPAEATGKLKAGQIIETINGRKLKDIDPRIQLGGIITETEASDGVLRFVVRDTEGAPTREVIVKIPVLGAYSKTWPLDCPKSERIVRDFAKVAARSGARALNGPAALFLLSTGDEKDLDIVRKWYRNKRGGGNYAWHLGYEAVPVAEYYLRTGDESVLPGIQGYVDAAEEIYYCGGWAGRGKGNFKYMGGGHMNAAGTHVLTFLLLARECGADVDDVVFSGALRQFYRYAGRGLNPYGDGRPESGFVDNGRCGSLAFAMGAAASLSSDLENSTYARARDVSSLKSYYTTGWMLHGHTGGGIGEIWRSAAMGLMRDKRPKQYRSFMDSRMWWYELSRRYDGSFGVLGGARYDKPAPWGLVMGLTYTAPRKTLRITGAPKSKYAKAFTLPVRPWGTEADDEFLSLKGATDKNGKTPAVEDETLTEHHPYLMLVRLRQDDVTEETVRYYAHHQDYAIRMAAAQAAAGIKPQYMRVDKAEKARYPGLIVEMLKSKDARVRWAGAYAVTLLPSELLTDGNFQLLAGMIDAPEESWYVVDIALRAITPARPEQIGPHVDRLVYWMEHEDWWMSSAAIGALVPLMTDRRYYKKIFPALGRVIATNQRFNRLAPLRGLGPRLWKADPDVLLAAAEMLGDAYTAYPMANTKWKVQPSHQADAWHLRIIAGHLSNVPHGLDTLYGVSRKRFPDEVLPHSELYLGSSHLDSNPVAKKAVLPIIENDLVRIHIARNRDRIKKLAGGETQSAYSGRDLIDTLVALHKKVGNNTYDWHMFADIRTREWAYHSFDPIAEEQVPWDQLITRYREVTMPEGMESWYALDFDAEKAGWKRGLGAFGQYDGRLPRPGDATKCKCEGDTGCYGGTTINTLWEKEVLLLRGTFKIPAVKEGHRYRLRVNEGNHVGMGGGFIIYINGSELTELKTCTGRGGGGLPKGGFITKEFFKDFRGGEVTIAVKTFIRFNSKYKVKPSTRISQGRISLHFEEQKLPPIGD